MQDEPLTKKDLDLINYQILELGKKIDDLRNNYTTRLDMLDAFQRNSDKVFAAKGDQDIINTKLRQDTDRNTAYINKGLGALAIINAVLLIVITYITLHR